MRYLQVLLHGCMRACIKRVCMHLSTDVRRCTCAHPYIVYRIMYAHYMLCTAYACIHLCMHACRYVYISMSLYAYKYGRMRTCLRMSGYLRIYAPSMHDTHASVHVLKEHMNVQHSCKYVWFMRLVRMSACMYACTYGRICVCIFGCALTGAPPPPSPSPLWCGGGCIKMRSYTRIIKEF